MAEKLSSAAIVLLVALRLVIGWQFYNEGVKKLDPGFSSAGFLRAAKGPLAPYFRSIAAGPHGAYELLGEPQEAGSRSPEVQAEYDAWLANYARDAARANRAGDPLPYYTPEDEPSARWVARVDSSWGSGLERLARLGASDSFLAEANALRAASLGELVYHLHTEADAIDEMRHEAWRLERMRAEGDAPFQNERIAEKDSEVWRALLPVVAGCEQIEGDFIGAVADLAAATEGAPSPGRVRSSLTERSFLSWVDFLVTWVVLLSGVCLFLGLFTPVAAVLAAGFLLSVIASQPPWVAGAVTDYFFYQLLEVIALLLLAATHAGQWAGLDGVFQRMRRCCGDLSVVSPYGTRTDSRAAVDVA